MCRRIAEKFIGFQKVSLFATFFVFLDQKLFAFQFALTFLQSFIIYYVVLRTSLWFQVIHMQHLYDDDSLDLISGFRGMFVGTLLFFEGPLFLGRQRYYTVSTIHLVVCHTINKATVKIFKFTQSLACMKDSFREKIGVVELIMVSLYEIFRRNLFQTSGRRYFINTIVFLLFQDNNNTILSHKIHSI